MSNNEDFELPSIFGEMDATSEMTFSEGHELAKKEYSKLAKAPQTSEEWVEFFHDVSLDIFSLKGISGVAAFITSEEVKQINVGQFSNTTMILEWSIVCCLGQIITKLKERPLRFQRSYVLSIIMTESSKKELVN